MDILCVGSGASEAQHVFSKAGHQLRTCSSEHHRILAEVKKSRPEHIVATDRLSFITLDWIKSNGLSLWGDSSWSKALQSQVEYQNLVLLRLEALGMNIGSGPYRLTVEGWWTGTDYAFAWWYQNKNRLCNEDVGPLVDCAWVAGKPLQFQSFLKREILCELKPFLTGTGYRGPVSLDLGVSESGVSILQLNAHVRIDSLVAMAELFQDPAQLLVQHKCRFGNLFCGGLKVRVLQEFAYSEERQLQVVSSGAQSHTAISEEQTRAIVTARGLDTTELRKRVFRTLKGLLPRSLVYRTDFLRGVQDLEGELSCLHLI